MQDINIKVKKRNGEIQQFTPEKIYNHIDKACEGLSDIYPGEIISFFKLKLHDKIETEEIQQALILAAADLITEESPNYQYVAARFVLQDIRKKIYTEENLEHKTDGWTPEFNYDILVKRIEKGYYDSEILNLFNQEEINRILNYINWDNDFNFTFSGITQMLKKYLIKYKGEIIETPQEAFMLIPMYIFGQIDKNITINNMIESLNEFNEIRDLLIEWKEKKYINFREALIIEFYNSISNFEIFLSTPPMVGIRSRLRGVTSCFKPDALIRLDELKTIKIGDVKIGDLLLTQYGNKKPITNIIKSYKTDFVKINTIASEKTLDCTIDHPIFAIKKEDIICHRNYKSIKSFGKRCVINQGKLSQCYKLKKHYRNDCPNLLRKFNIDEIADFYEAQELELGDYISIPIPIKTISNKIKIYNIIKNYPKIKNLNIKIIDNKICKLNKDPKHIKNGNNGIDIKINAINNEIVIDEDLMEVFGWFMAEGSCWSKSSTIAFTVSVNEVSYLERINSIIKDKFGVSGKITIFYEPTRNAVLTINSVYLRAFMEIILNNFKDKFFEKSVQNNLINNLLIKIDPKLQKHFLKGYFLGDGSFNKKLKQLQASTKDKKFIEIIKIMLLRNKILFRAGFEKNNKLKNPNSRDSYTVSIKATYGKKELEFIKFIDKYNDLTIYDNIEINKHYSKVFYFDNYLFTQITRKELYKEKEPIEVIDITVDDDHTFIAGDFAVHNCAGLTASDSIEALGNTAKSMYKLVTKLRAGIGVNEGYIRGAGADIDNGMEIHTGIIPYVKVNEAISVSSQQPASGRSGQATHYYPWFHWEIEDILVLKNNRGYEEKRARHNDHAISFNKIFYKKLMNDEDVALFHMNEVDDLYDEIGNEEYFEKKYNELVSNPKIEKRWVSAKRIWDNYWDERYGTARVYKVNADDFQRHSAFNLPVNMSNLCLEINLCSFPDEDLIFYVNKDKINDFWNWFKRIREEGKWIDIYKIIYYKKSKNQLKDLYIRYPETAKEFFDYADIISRENYTKQQYNFGEIFSCILGGINFGIYTSDKTKIEKVKLMTKNMFLLTWFLDYMIDYQDYVDIKPFERFTKERRALGVSPGNLYYLLAQYNFNYDSKDARELINDIMEIMNYSGILSSAAHAKFRGKCSLFNDTKYSKGIFSFDTYNKNVDEFSESKLELGKETWNNLKDIVKKYGMRNSTLFTAVPSSNSSRPGNMISGINPPQGLSYVVKDKKVSVKVLVPEVQKYKKFYEKNLAWEHDNIEYWKMISVFQKWIDQSISLNQYVDYTKYTDERIPEDEVLKTDLFSIKYGIKTLYYIKPKTTKEDALNKEEAEENEGCSGGGCTL